MANNSEVTYLGSGFNPSELDVIVGRGKVCYKHSGNLRLARIVQSVLGTYSSAEATKKSKTELIKSIVSQVRESSPEGGFVKFDSEKGEWFEVGDRTAREKVSQAFRDALTDQYKSSSTSKTLKRRQERITRQTSNDSTGNNLAEPGTPGGTLQYGAPAAADPVASLPFGSMSLASPSPRRGVRGVGLPSPSPRRSYTLPSRPAPRLSLSLGTASPRTSLGLGTPSPRSSMSSCLPSPGGNSLAALTASPGSTFGLTASPGAASFGGLAAASPGAASLQGFAASPSPAAAMRSNLVSPLSAGFSTSPGRQQLSRFSASPSPLTMSLQNVGAGHHGMPPVHGESPSSIRLAVAIAERKRRLTNLNMMMAARGAGGVGGGAGGQARPTMGGGFGGAGRPQVPHTL